MKKALCLLSSGIDSPVAAYLMGKQIDVDCVHFEMGSFGDKRIKEKAEKNIKQLEKVLDRKIKLYSVEHGPHLKKFKENCDDRLTCVLCKRVMFRIAERLAKEEGYDFLVTGDNLSQVASQTLENMYVITKSVEIPVLRPLLCFDKNEIIEIAKEIGTFEISIEKDAGCKAVPQQPATKSKVNVLERQEERADVKHMVEEASWN